MTTRPVRRPTPRPRYSEPTIIRRNHAPQHLWGDPESGFVSDIILLSNDALHVIEWSLPPRGSFGSSSSNPTCFAADVAYVVLEGTMAIGDASTGQVSLAEVGDLVWVQRDVWHHAHALGDSPLRVLEYMAPPPALGTASSYGQTQTPPDPWLLRDPRWQQQWPPHPDQLGEPSGLQVLRPESHQHWLTSNDPRHLGSTALDREFLMVGTGVVASGAQTSELVADHDTVVVATAGQVSVFFPERHEQAWHHLTVGDAVYLPQGCVYMFFEGRGEQARYWWGAGRPTPSGWRP